MAAFRWITAEEEAATAVIHSLQAKRYIGAERLNPRDHLTKNAIWIVIEEFLGAFKDKLGHQIRLDFHKRPKPGIKVSFAANITHSGDGSSTRTWISPKSPLDVNFQPNDGHYIKGDEFRKRAEFAKNERNKILYASSDGVPSVELGEGFFEDTRKRVLSLVATSILIMQHPSKQVMAQQYLEALLREIGKPLKTRIDYEAHFDLPEPKLKFTFKNS